MSDITMCMDETCEKRKKCYRFRAIPSEYQSMSMFGEGDKTNCEYFMTIFTDDKKALSELGEGE